MQGRDKGSGYKGMFIENRGLLHDGDDARLSSLLSLWGPSSSMNIKDERGKR